MSYTRLESMSGMMLSKLSQDAAVVVMDGFLVPEPSEAILVLSIVDLLLFCRFGASW